MRKTSLIIAGLLILLLICACSGQEETSMEPTIIGSVTLVNNVQDTDVWILPQTEENLKPTLWGAATAAKVKTGESRSVSLCEPGDDGFYLLRMIDTEGFYYSANGLFLEANWTIQIKETDQHSFTADVLNADGSLVATYELFSAKL